MANFTETTNYKFKKPTVGADTDQWGSHLNETIDGVDSQLKTLADSITTQQLEQLGNVVNVTPVDDQFLRYNGTNWTAETVSIPDVLNDLSNVSGTPSSGDVLTYNGSAWSPASVTSAAVADGSVTNAKLHPSLQTVIGRILVTDDDDSPTDNQILVYSTSDAEWKYADQAGSTLQTLTDVSTTGLSDGDLMKYDGTAGEFVFIDAAAARTLLNVDVSGTDNSTPVTLNTTSHDYLTLSSQQITLGPIVLTDDVSGTLPIANGGTSATTAAGARTTLGLGTLATQSTITESQISDLQPYITASSTDTLTNKSGAISQWTNDSGYLTAETNDLSASVTWANVPDVNITQSSVTQHQAALTITESQISDLQSYLTAETNDLGSAVTGTLPIANGGTGQTTAAAARIALLPTLGTAGQVLAVNTGATDVEWVNAAAGVGLGTVTSVAISGTDGIEVDSGSPITTSGTIALGINAATLSSHLSLGTAATTASTDYATAAQGALADSAVQPGDNANTLGSGAATDGYVLTAVGDGTTAWEAVSGGGGTDVTLAGSLDYLTLSGQEITLNAIDLTTDVSGTLPVGNGGTGLTAGVSNGDLLVWNSTTSAWDSTKDLSNGIFDFATIYSNYFVIEDKISPPTNEKYSGFRSIYGNIRFETLYDDRSSADTIFEVTRTGTTVDTFDFKVTPSVNGTDLLSGTVAVANGGTGVTALSSLDAADLGSGAATDGYVLTADGAGGAAWEAASGGAASLPIDLLSSGASIRKSDGTTAVLSESSGAVTLENVANAYLSGGVYLGGTAAANYLDDVEEGTFTPTYIFSISGSVTHNLQEGIYTKIKNVVYFSIRIQTSAISSPTGNIRISNLPFTSGSTTRYAITAGDARSWGTSFTRLICSVESNHDFVTLSKNATNGSFSAIQGSDMAGSANNNYLNVTGFYLTV